MQSLGGRSGITSMLSRHVVVQPMSVKVQQESVARLYQRTGYVSGSDTTNMSSIDETTEFQSNFKLKQVQLRMREKSSQQVTDDQASSMSRATPQIDESGHSQTQISSPRVVKRNFIIEKLKPPPQLKQPSPVQILSEKLNALTFEDINKMHYTKLNRADNKADHFDPKQLIDMDSDDDDHEILKTIKSPTRKSQPLKSIIKSPQARSISSKPPQPQFLASDPRAPPLDNDYAPFKQSKQVFEKP